MAKNDPQYRRRGRILEHARDLARSGAHADHTTIIPQLENLDDFPEARSRIEERAFRTQLDRLCAMARDPHQTQVDLAALRASRHRAGAGGQRRRV